MSTSKHTPHPLGSFLNASVINAPLGELDAAIVAEENARIAATGTSSYLFGQVAMVQGEINRIDGLTTSIDATASSGQKVVPVASTVGFRIDEEVFIGNSTNYEWRTIGSIQAGVSLTMTANLTNGYSSGIVARAPKIPPAAVHATQRVLKKLETGDLHVNIVVLSDSTGMDASASGYSASGRWPEQLAAALGVLYPAVTVKIADWSTGDDDWSELTTIQSGSGAVILTMWNGSAGARNTTYPLSRIDRMVTEKVPDLILIAHGHNEHDDVSGYLDGRPWRTRMLTLTESVAAANPQASICLVDQNAQIYVGGALASARAQLQKVKVTEYAWIAQTRGYGYIPTRQAFIDTGSPTTYLNSDGLHPNSAGVSLMFATIFEAFRYRRSQQMGSQPPSSLLDPAVNLLRNGNFADFASPPTLPGWVATNATLSKDTSTPETAHAWGLRIQAASAAAAYITNDATEQAALARQCRGQWVTLAARFRVAAATGEIGGVLAMGTDVVDNTVASVVSHHDEAVYGEYLWKCISLFVDPAATTLYVRFQAALGSVAAADVTVSRLVLARGMLPRDCQ